MPSAEWYANRRRERLEAHQNALPEEDRIVNRDDWDQEIGRRISVITARARENAKQKFLTLAIEPAVNICETPEQALMYFTRGGPPFTTSVLRKFAEAVAISSNSILVEGAMAARSCDSTLIYLWTAAKAAGNPVHRDVKEATLAYIHGPLITRGLIHTITREKVTPIPEDLTTFIRMMFDPRFAGTLFSTRELLLLVLFVCLQVDCSARATELVMPSMSKIDTKAYKEAHPEKMFRWSSVEIFAFQNETRGGRVTLQARLTFRGIKDTAQTGYRVKSVPLRLLPPTHVAEDSLFWLVTLGLIDGVFASVSSWADIERLQPGKNGLLLPIKDDCQQSPVSSVRRRRRKKKIPIF